MHSSRSPVNTATVVAADLAAVALAVAILTPVGSWWRSGRRTAAAAGSASQAAAAADRLAVEMAGRWKQEAARRRIVTPAPVRVRWRWAAGLSAREDVTAAPAPGAGLLSPAAGDRPGEALGSGVATRLHDELYARLPHGRLVLVGGAGAGKTAAMLLLLLAALDRRSGAAGDAERGRVPVPVWLTLGGWDPARGTLRAWAAERMNLDHPSLRAPAFGPDAAGELLRSGRVALFLDGLDEMPPEARVRALKRIEEEAAGLRLVHQQVGGVPGHRVGVPAGQYRGRRTAARAAAGRGRLPPARAVRVPPRPVVAACRLPETQSGQRGSEGAGQPAVLVPGPGRLREPGSPSPE